MKIADMPTLVPGSWYLISFDFRNLGYAKGSEFPVIAGDNKADSLFAFHYFDWSQMRERRCIAQIDTLLSCRLMSVEEVAKYRIDTVTTARSKAIDDLNSELRSMFGTAVDEAEKSV